MTTSNHTNIVREIYKNFLNGNIDAIINELSENIRWSIPGYPENPSAGNFVGKSEVTGFFQNLAKHLEYAKFEPKEYFTSGDNVAVLGYQESTALDTGRKLSGEWIMKWEFDSRGKVVDFKYYDDTLKTANAFKK